MDRGPGGGHENIESMPTELSIQAGQAAQIVVKNRDFGVHTFTIEDLDIDVTVVGGSEKLVSLAVPSAGTYQCSCEIEGHDDMKRTLTVQ